MPHSAPNFWMLSVLSDTGRPPDGPVLTLVPTTELEAVLIVLRLALGGPPPSGRVRGRERLDGLTSILHYVGRQRLLLKASHSSSALGARQRRHVSDHRGPGDVDRAYAPRSAAAQRPRACRAKSVRAHSRGLRGAGDHRRPPERASLAVAVLLRSVSLLCNSVEAMWSDSLEHSPTVSGS